KSNSNIIIYIIAFIAALAGLLFGYDTGVISGAILFIKDQFNLTSQLEERVVSAVLLGAVIGAAFSGAIADRLGRRRSIVITALLFSAGAVGCAFAPSIPVLVACRLLIGLAIGVASYVAPLYISEISPANVRGALVSLNQLMITCGIVVSYLVAYALTLGQNEWRWMFGLGAIPAIILLIGMFYLPESPRWLVSQGLIEKAKKVLQKTSAGKNSEEEIRKISQTVTDKGCCWKEVFAPWIRPALFIGIALAFFQQATGINTIIYYAPTIFEFAGFASHKVAILATVGVGIVNVLMTLVAIWLLDRIGRKPLLYLGMSGMALSLGLLGFAF
ncbi:MAG: sugar porter family MFS transporter, partial [Candidatus Omnitrophica bacterium]|nr:sugar porter family MFS transporter [Candidatus Omnitrophota bacterium]